jgi:hypothetical protein
MEGLKDKATGGREEQDYMLIASVISRARAEELLSKKAGPLSPRRKLVKTELIYLPVYLFALKLEDKRGRVFAEKISVDGIRGEFAFVKEINYDPSPPDNRHTFEFGLTEKKARDIAEREYKRILFKDNLKTGNNVTITGFRPGRKIYYPYWIGYFKRKKAYDFSIIDAVDGGKQGIKMRPVFFDLLMQTSGQQGR